MKRLLAILLTLLPLVAAAQHTYFGYSPLTEDAQHLAAIGTGKSTMLDAAICLNAKADPVVERLKGQRILGVRIFARADYKTSQQASNRYAFYTLGSLNADPVKTTCKLSEGWNEVLFSQPITIGDEPIFLGARIYETFGTPYPFCNYRGAVAPNGYFVRAGGKEGTWATGSQSGVLLIQAILEDNDALTAPDGPLAASAHVSFSDTPLTVNPDSPMTGSLYLHNQSAQTIQKVTFATSDDRGVEHTYTIDLADQPLPPYDGRSISYRVYAPSEEGTAQALTFRVLSLETQDGQTLDAQGRSIAYTGQYYVMKDAFVRVPVVEEYTSQRCVNCPMMAYYLDRAIEKWREEGRPLVYVTHHTGFAKDSFTQPTDKDVLFLFGPDGDTFNPAVMYDRRVFSGDDTPIHSAKVAEVSVYTECIEAVNNVAAMAEVNVTLSDDQRHVTVSGKVNRNFALEQIPIYLNCYLIEDGIPTTDYPQEGLDTDGAPDDLASSYRHNGVARHVFTKNGVGDLLDVTITDDAATFSVTYDYPETLSPLPILDDSRTDIVAFLHIYDETVMHNNYILNGGSLSLSGGKMPSSIHTPNCTEALPTKFLQRGQLLIHRDGRLYNAAGVQVK